MQILFSPQENEERIEYTFNGEVISITINGVSENFDFTGIPNGELELFNQDGSVAIETKLDPFPILSAKKEGGILYVELLNWISGDASKKEKFPEWIDSVDYGKENSKGGGEK